MTSPKLAQLDLKKAKEAALKHDPMYQLAVDSIPYVKEFIKARKLIIYGGTAIDFALRLKGHCIYPDESLSLPDLDFYSPNHVQDAYDLADILYQAGYKEARAITASYIRAMKVDIVDNHFIADISYVPKAIFDRLTYIEYEGMRIIDPLFQKVDLHASLSFLFDGAPKEVIFNRLKKDIERFNILHKLYPSPPKCLPTGPQEEAKSLLPRIVEGCVTMRPKASCPITLKEGIYPISSPEKFVYSGMAAYALLYRAFLDLKAKIGPMSAKKAKDEAKEADKGHFQTRLEEWPKEAIIPATFEINTNNITVSKATYYDNLTIVSSAPKATLKDLGERSKWSIYNAFINVFPAKYEADLITVYDTSNRLISVNTIVIDGKSITFTNVQFVLMYFMGMALFDKTPEIYYCLYESTLKIIEAAEGLIAGLDIPDEDKVGLLLVSPFYPSLKVYGDKNITESELVIEQNLKVDIGEINRADIDPLPVNYYPCRGHQKRIFTYEGNSHFEKDGSRKKAHSEANEDQDKKRMEEKGNNGTDSNSET
jgi:Poly(A) polymerase catalytic subunit